MTSVPPPRITYLTAGAAGMYCGSCMHDNTLARALLSLGVDVQLVPLYTPITTDEEDVTTSRVFFGGLNVYLQQQARLFRHLPKVVDRWLDHPALLRWVGSRGVEIKPTHLGELTLSMLRGAAGFQRKEVDRLCQWLRRDPRPELLVLTNVLIAGCVPDLRQALGIPIAVTLQGDDVFLEGLSTPYRQQALDQIRRLAEHIDAFLVHSQYYARFMADYLAVDPAKFRLVPLGIDTAEFPSPAFDSSAIQRPGDAPRVGYLARLAPEKGLHVLVDAFIRLRQYPDMDRVQLVIAGWLGTAHRPYVQSQLNRLHAAGLGEAHVFLGAVDRTQKIELLRGLHVLSVPTIYREPKGLYVLEALAAGVPVVQPDHGAFPELLAATGGGRLFPPGDAQALAEILRELLRDPAHRRELAAAGHAAVHARFNAQKMAERTLGVFRALIDR